MKPTFQQIATLGICIISLIGVVVVYTLPKNDGQGIILGALLASFAGAGSFFYKTSFSSTAKDEAAKDTTNKLVSALSNSAPVMPKSE